MNGIRDSELVVLGRCSRDRMIFEGWRSRDVTFAALPSKSLSLRGATIDGDIRITGPLPEYLEIDLSNAHVSGDLLIGSTERHTNIPDDSDHDGYPEADTEGCWRYPGTPQTFRRVTLDGLRARNVSLWQVVLREGLGLAHAVIEDTVFLEHSYVGGPSHMRFLRARNLEFVGTEFHTGADLFSADISGNADFQCTTLTGSLEAYGITGGGTVQLIGAVCNNCTVSFARGKIDVLTLRGMTGRVHQLNLKWARVGMLSLANAGGAPESTVFDAPWSFGKVLTGGLELSAMADAPENGRVHQVISAAAKDDDAAYDRFAKAYTKDGHFDYADRVWTLGFPIIRDLNWLWGISIAIVVFLAGTLFRILPGLHTRREAFLLAIDLYLPDLVDLHTRDRFKDELTGLPFCWRAILAVVRLAGWLVIPTIIWLTAARLGRG